MQMKEVTVSGNAEETRQWMLALQAVTGGGKPVKESREDFQIFRWAMMENYRRIQDAWALLKVEIENERDRVLMKHCGSKARFDEYSAEMKRSFGPFAKYLQPTGGYELPKGDIQRRFNAVKVAMTKKYADIDAAGEEFSKRQAEMFAQNIDVKMVCCDYTEVPTDVNCAYLDFLSKIMYGFPTLSSYHPLVKNKVRGDLNYAAKLTGKIVVQIEAGKTAGKTTTDIALDVMNALFDEAAVQE